MRELHTKRMFHVKPKREKNQNKNEPQNARKPMKTMTTFKNYLLHNRGLSENTANAYCEALRDFAQHTNEKHPGTTWRTVTKTMIDEYVVTMVAEGSKPATIKQHVSALRTFFKTCQALGLMTENPARYVSTPRLGTQLPKTIETEAIKAALESNTVSKEAKAAIAIIFETGIRLQELLDLKPEDIDPKTGTMHIKGKGKKERTVYYGNLCKKYGRCWNGEGKSQRAVRHMVFTALQPYSKSKQLSPHALRHTYASQLLNNGMSIEAISKLLGHEHIETTEIYAQLANSKARELYLNFAPTL